MPETARIVATALGHLPFRADPRLSGASPGHHRFAGVATSNGVPVVGEFHV